MKWYAHSIVIISCLFCNDTIFSGQANFAAATNSAAGSLKKVYDGGKSFVTGIGQSFGYVSPAYLYKCIAWNDTPGPITVVDQRVTGIMGAKFNGNIRHAVTLNANTNTENIFVSDPDHTIHLYAAIWLCKASDKLAKYGDSVTQATEYGTIASVAIAATGAAILGPVGVLLALPAEALTALIGSITVEAVLNHAKILHRAIDLGPDPGKNPEYYQNVYHYRAYTYKGQVQGEYLGVKGLTSDFAGIFYNSTTAKDITLSFTKGTQRYQVLLEPNSYNVLQSGPNSTDYIRPQSNDQRGFIFAQAGKPLAYIPLSQQGIANVSYNENTKSYDVTGPMTYTYEVHAGSSGPQPEVGIQGLAIGSYNQPMANVRDINPLECHVWLPSVVQQKAADAAAAKKNNTPPAEQDSNSVMLDSFDPIWISYVSQDYTYQQKITAGSVADFHIIRPRLQEMTNANMPGKTYLIIAQIHSSDEAQARLFLNRIHKGVIGQNALQATMSVDALRAYGQQNIDPNLLVKPLPNMQGIVDDTQGVGASGIRGTILLADVFTPRGVGQGPFYYIVPPSSLQIGDIIKNMYLDAAQLDIARNVKPDVMKDLQSKIISWMQRYPAGADQIKNEVTKYLEQYGDKTIYASTSDTKQEVINQLLTGPISIAHPPWIKQAGTNYFVYGFGQKPDSWPS